MKLFAEKLCDSVKKLDKFAVLVLHNGFRLSAGLIMLSALFYTIAGKFGNYMSAIDCAKGALEAAPAVFTGAVISALISDIAVKDRAQKS